MINYIKTDIFQTNHNIIGHCVNNEGVFNAGIARQIALKYPQAKAPYLKAYQQGSLSVGKIQIVKINEIRFIANMCMQETYGHTGIHVIYPAVKEAFTKLIDWAEQRNLSIAIPKVCSGLAGGDWNKISSIIEECLVGKNVVIDVHYL